MEYSKQGLDLTARFEGLRLKAYRDIVGVWTIGYGHTGPDVFEGQEIIEAQARDLLEKDIATAVDAVNRLVTVQLTQGEFDALVDFVYNLGETKFAGSTLLRHLNEGDHAAAAEQFELWDHAGGKEVAGLLRRRLDERTEFEG